MCLFAHDSTARFIEVCIRLLELLPFTIAVISLYIKASHHKMMNETSIFPQAATQKAEAAASRAGSSIASGHTEGLAYLQPLLLEAKRLQEIEGAEDALQKAVAAYNSLSDLTKLEAAILVARKVKDVSPDILR